MSKKDWLRGSDHAYVGWIDDAGFADARRLGKTHPLLLPKKDPFVAPVYSVEEYARLRGII